MNDIGFWAIDFLKVDCDIIHVIKQLYMNLSIKLIYPPLAKELMNGDYHKDGLFYKGCDKGYNELTEHDYHYHTNLYYVDNIITYICFYYKGKDTKCQPIWTNGSKDMQLYQFGKFHDSKVKYGYTYMHGCYGIEGKIIFRINL